jgi:hypothetical protein
MAVTAEAVGAVSRGFAGRAFGIDLRADFRVPGVLEPADAGHGHDVGARRIDLALRKAAAANMDWPSETAERTFELREPSAAPVFTIDHEPQAGYRVWIDGLGQCVIGPEGDRIVLSPPRGPSRWHLLIGQGLPIAAALQGLEVLHASAVRFGPEAVAFIAPSGTGKTSLALHLLAHGAEFLADDVVALEAAGDTLMTLPGIGLAHAPWAERAALERAGVEMSFSGQPGAKEHVVVGLPEAPVPLGAAYFLERTPVGDAIEIIPIDPPDPCLLLAATFVSHVPTARRLITQLDVCSRIARTVPLFRVRVPVHGCASDLAERVARHFGRGA